jgi:hypothetical protein
MEVEVPHNWEPREYQLPLWKAMEQGCKRAVAVWHRRAGKDLTSLNFTVAQMVQRVGTYWHIFPTYNQGRKIIWDGITKDGKKYTDFFPSQLLAKKPNETEMKITFKNNSLWQVVGSDNFNTIVGPNPIGCVFSEYALQNPQAWEFIRPILRENDGWAIFLYTPRGHNHGYKLFNRAKVLDDWFAQLLTVEDTVDVITQEDIEKERAEGMADELVEQEYFCSFDAPLHGSYYGKLLSKAETDGRIANVPYDPAVLVDTWWDLGIGDSTAIWFSQSVGQEIRFIDYYETSGEGLSHYKKILQDKPYSYGEHWAPHDIEVRELGSGKTRKEMAKELGIIFRVAFNLKVEDGINAVRMTLNRCWFDQTKCEFGLEALKEYHKEWDDKMREFKNHPYHDWSSHAADAFRYFAVSYHGHPKEKAQEQRTALMQYDEFSQMDDPLM